MSNSAELYGRGLGFPPRIGANGQLEWSQGETNVRENICIILQTRPGERLMLPEFGCGLDQYLFEPNNTATRRLIQEAVVRSLQQWEPRIQIDKVIVDVDPENERAVNILVNYILVATSQRERLNMTLNLR